MKFLAQFQVPLLSFYAQRLFCPPPPSPLLLPACLSAPSPLSLIRPPLPPQLDSSCIVVLSFLTLPRPPFFCVTVGVPGPTVW